MSKERVGHYIVYGTLMAIGAAGITGVGGCGENGEKQYCISPVASSPAYSGDKTPGVTGEYKTWRYGAMAFLLNAPDVAGYEGTVISFKNPANPNAAWHASDPVGKNDAAENVVQVGIGSGDVQFDMAFVGEAGSAACITAPNVRWTEPAPLAGLIGTKPQWTGQGPTITPSVAPPVTPSQPQTSPS
jgi:hypothetical protein